MTARIIPALVLAVALTPAAGFAQSDTSVEALEDMTSTVDGVSRGAAGGSSGVAPGRKINPAPSAIPSGDSGGATSLLPGLKNLGSISTGRDSGAGTGATGATGTPRDNGGTPSRDDRRPVPPAPTPSRGGGDTKGGGDL